MRSPRTVLRAGAVLVIAKKSEKGGDLSITALELRSDSARRDQKVICIPNRKNRPSMIVVGVNHALVEGTAP